MKKLLIALSFLFITSNAFAWFEGSEFVSSNLIAGTCTTDAGVPLSPVKISSDTTKIQGLIIRAKPGNLRNVYVGNCSRISAVESILITADTVVCLDTNSLTENCIISDQAGQGISWLAIKP
jgi:hypothetical protein